jgi:uncharacterized delta-60 repeat protein
MNRSSQHVSLEPMESRRLMSAGMPDAGFSGDGRTTVDFAGRNDRAGAAVVQPDGKILVAGNSSIAYAGTPADQMRIVRFNTNGSIDNSFFFDLPRQFAADIDSLALQGDGKVIVAGYFVEGDAARGVIMRLNADGTFDKTFTADHDGIYYTPLAAGVERFVKVGVASDGKIIASGFGQHQLHAARLLANGNPDTTFDGDGVASLSAGAFTTGLGFDLDAAGRIVVVGSVQDVETGPADLLVARFTTDGKRDTSFFGTGWRRYDSGASEGAADVAVLKDGRILVGGDIGDFAGFWRFNSNGQFDNTFNGHGSIQERVGHFAGMVVQNTGKIVLMTRTNFVVDRCNADGTPDLGFAPASFATAGKFYGAALSPVGNERVVAVGTAEPTRHAYDWAVMKLQAASIPNAPGSASAVALGSDRIHVTWSDRSVNETSFEVQRSTSGLFFGAGTVVSTNVTTLDITGLSPSTKYYFRIRARNAEGNSTWSSVASAVTAAPPAVGGASISGKVFNDANGNGKLDAGEVGLANRALYIDLDNDRALDFNEPIANTDASGSFKFAGLAAGTYKVRQILPAGWAQTTPANGFGIGVTLAADQSISGKLFGEQQIA